MAISYHLYLREDKKRANGECPVYLRITQDRRSRYVTTGVFIHPKYWNDEKEIVRKGHTESTFLNTILKDAINSARKVQADLLTNGDDSAKAIQQHLKSQQTGDYFELADELLEELTEQNKYYALKRLKVVNKKIEKFIGDRELPLKEITSDWLEDFETYLKVKFHNGANTISKDFEPVRKIIQRALKMHLISTNPLIHFSGAKRKKSKAKTKLSIEQIKAIENLELPENSWLWNTRNAFLFSFYSAGIRFGDICCLKWSNVQNDRLTYKMNKNDKSFSVELNQYQKSILSNYKGSDDEYIFPFLNSNKKYNGMDLRKTISSKNAIVNKNLSEIAKAVNKKIDKEKIKLPKIHNLSFHVSRHSYAQYAVESGLNTYELMQTLRHSKLETTQKYLKSLNEELADKAMKKVF